MIPDLPDISFIVEKLKASGFTQRKIADLTGIDPRTVEKLFRSEESLTYSKVRDVVHTVNEEVRRQEPAATAADVCTSEVSSVTPRDHVSKAWEIFSELECDQVPVCEKGEPVGSVTTGGLGLKVAEGIDYLDLLDLPVGRVMEPAFPEVDGAQNLAIVKYLLLGAPAVLVRISGEVKGIVTWHDVLDPKKNPRVKLRDEQSREG